MDTQPYESPAQPFMIGPAEYIEPAQPEPRPEQMLGDFLQAARDLVARLRQREEEFSHILQITERVNYGLILEEVLDFLYDEMSRVIPYNRIGCSLIGQGGDTVVARWARSDRPMLLGKGYEAPLAGSTLQTVIESGRPRIISDLEAYLAGKPHSDSTALVVREGMKSSLTCPLIVQGRPVGFIFFSSDRKHTYRRVHVDFFQQIAGQVAAIVEKSRLYSTLAEQKAQIEEQNRVMLRDLDMARKVQQSLIPQHPPTLKDLDVAFEYAPAIQVGGDVLDIITLSEDRVLFFLADAVGHGVQAALIVSVIKTALQSAVRADPRPAEVLANLNRVTSELFEQQFVTAACCLWDGRLRTAQLALAGHPRPLWHKRSSGQVAEVGQAGLPLGIDAQTVYPETAIALASGDVLLLFTDGVSEAFNPSGGIYETAGMVRQLEQHDGAGAQELLKSIRADLDRHCDGLPLQDDLALLVIQRRG